MTFQAFSQTEENTFRSRTTNSSRSIDSLKETNYISSGNRKLLEFCELEKWQQDNKYILTGYRNSDKSYKSCFYSLTYLHNESINIFSHLLPGIFFFIVGSLFLEYWLPNISSVPLVEKLAIFCFPFSAAICLNLSASYHMLISHSENVSRKAQKLDYIGIVLLITGSYIPSLYYGWNPDFPNYCYLFWSITIFLATICLVLSLNDAFGSPEYRNIRTTVFVLFGLSGLIPIATGFYISGYHETFEKTQLGWLLAEGGAYIFGAFLYAYRFPERKYPKVFDIFGSSHQIFHFFVVIGGLCEFKALINQYKLFHNYN